MRHLLLLVILLVAASANAQQPVTVVFSPKFATETLAALEAAEKLDNKLERRLLCVRQKQCIDSREFQGSQDKIVPNVNVQLSMTNFQKWLTHLNHPGEKLDPLLRYDLCQAFRGGVDSRNLRFIGDLNKQGPCVGILKAP